MGPAGERGPAGPSCPDVYSLKPPADDPDALVCRRDGAPYPEPGNSPAPQAALDPARRQNPWHRPSSAFGRKGGSSSCPGAVKSVDGIHDEAAGVGAIHGQFGEPCERPQVDVQLTGSRNGHLRRQKLHMDP